MKNIEYELDEAGNRTGRWRGRQYYAAPGIHPDRRVPSERKACEFREPRKR